MTISAYIRACVFGEEAEKRKRRPRNIIEDKKVAAEAIRQATQCKKYLFSVSLNPPPDAFESVESLDTVIAPVERDLGLSCQPKAVVFHEKNGRRHAHVVWSRIDPTMMKAIQLPHDKHKLMAISRDLCVEHGWEMPEGFKDHSKRDPNRFTSAEAGQACRHLTHSPCAAYSCSHALASTEETCSEKMRVHPTAFRSRSCASSPAVWSTVDLRAYPIRVVVMCVPPSVSNISETLETKCIKMQYPPCRETFDAFLRRLKLLAQ